MPVISVLPSAVADQIAAGEVVERPASVVKELIENSVDAGATSIEISVSGGGRTLVKVSDDGCGMDPSDAVLALARHGTSKIRSSADLEAVSTFGFRGEALPAICSVSRVVIETATASGEGTTVSATAGGAPTASPTSRRRGTTVSVADLFFNSPSRAAFLRGERSEWRAITDAVTTLALARREIRIDLLHDGKRALSAAPAESLRARLGALWGARYADALLDVDDVMGPIHISGLVERPADVGTATRRVFIAVNGRAIRDAGLVRAAENAYRSTIPAGARPSLYLDIVLPAAVIDVNVHPAKAEIRFRDRWPVERAVEGAVRRALGTFDSGAAFGRRFFARPVDAARATVDNSVLAADALTDPLFESACAAPAAQEEPGGAGPQVTARDVTSSDIPTLTQLRRTYIAFEHEDGLVLIDQHSAHERVLYELFLATFESGAAPSQRLLLPFTISLAPPELDALDASAAHLARLGFEIEPFGGASIVVHAVPTPHARFDAERCLRDTLSALTGDRVAGSAAHARTAPRHGGVQGGGEERRRSLAARDACALCGAARYETSRARRPRPRYDSPARVERGRSQIRSCLTSFA